MRDSWLGKIYRFIQYPVFRRLVFGVLSIALYSYVVMLEEIRLLGKDIEFPPGIQTLFTLVLSILLVMRTNTCYDRWWEGRKLWGQLTQAMRHLGQLIVASDLPEAEKMRARELQERFPQALLEHLRALQAPAVSQPLVITKDLYKMLASWKRDKVIETLEWQSMERHLSLFQDVTGGCERIRRTSPPLSHRACVPQVLIAYLLLLPWGLHNSMVSVAVVSLVAYFTISIELIAEELTDPFGLDPDDLPLESLVAGMGRNLAQIYG